MKEYIIFPYSIKGDKVVLIDEEILKSKYPMTYKYLKDMKEELDKRDKGVKKLNKWYAYGRTQGLNKYGKKLFLRIEHGQYMFNPDLLIKVNDEWYKIYDLLNIREIDYNEYRPDKEDQDVLHEAWYQDFIARIDKSFNKKMN